jgi:hypothetical protein
MLARASGTFRTPRATPIPVRRVGTTEHGIARAWAPQGGFCGLSGLSRRSGRPAPGATVSRPQTRVPAESDFTSSWLGMFVDGVTTPLLKVTARGTDEMSGYTTPVALRGKHRAVHPFQYLARSGHGCGRVIGLQREAGARARLAL